MDSQGWKIFSVLSYARRIEGWHSFNVIRRGCFRFVFIVKLRSYLDILGWIGEGSARELQTTQISKPRQTFMQYLTSQFSTGIRSMCGQSEELAWTLTSRSFSQWTEGRVAFKHSNTQAQKHLLSAQPCTWIWRKNRSQTQPVLDLYPNPNLVQYSRYCLPPRSDPQTFKCVV